MVRGRVGVFRDFAQQALEEEKFFSFLLFRVCAKGPARTNPLKPPKPPFGLFSRARTQSTLERDDGGERHGGGEVGRELVVAGGHAPDVFEAAERRLDAPTVA